MALVGLLGTSGPAVSPPAEAAGLVGAQDPAWAPDGKRVAVSVLDTIWTMTPDGKQPLALVAAAPPGVERDPAYAPDGARIAFTADRGTGFDIYVATVRDGTVTPVTSMPGDERWPSWTPDGRLVFAGRATRNGRQSADPGAQWDLYVVREVAGSPAWQTPVALTDTLDSETYPRVSPDGAKVAYGLDPDKTFFVPDDVLAATHRPARRHLVKLSPKATNTHRPLP